MDGIFSPLQPRMLLWALQSSEFGAPITEFQLMPNPRLESSFPGKLEGQTLFADRFGNYLTSFGKFTQSKDDWLVFKPWQGDADPFSVHPSDIRLELPSGKHLVWAKTFAEIPPGECAVILGSSGLLEIVANRQSAANLLNLQPDEPVTLRFNPKNAN